MIYIYAKFYKACLQKDPENNIWQTYTYHLACSLHLITIQQLKDYTFVFSKYIVARKNFEFISPSLIKKVFEVAIRE